MCGHATLKFHARDCVGKQWVTRSAHAVCRQTERTAAYGMGVATRYYSVTRTMTRTNGAEQKLHVCSVITTFLRSAFGLLSPARVCLRLRSSLTRRDSNIVCLSWAALYTGLGMWRVLISTCALVAGLHPVRNRTEHTAILCPLRGQTSTAP